MSGPAQNVPLSVLDLAPISAGATAAEALANSIDLARHAEAWGFRRHWVAEHHFVAVASSAPDVLIGAIAAATKTIRVGSAAVQFGHRTAVSVTEAFGTLDALYPGRIDLGIGRSGHLQVAKAAREGTLAAQKPPEQPPRATQVRDGLVIPPPFSPTGLLANPRILASFGVLQQEGALIPDFDAQVDDVLALLAGRYRTPEDVELTVVPGAGAQVQTWIFGSSAGPSAALAGRLGLPFGANYHVSPATTVEAVDAYRAAFRPSAVLDAPYVVVSADAVAAESEEQALHLASTFGHWAHSVRSGAGAAPYLDPDTTAPLTAAERELVEDRIITQFVGSPDQVAQRLETLVRVTGADELVVTSVAYRHGDRLRSYELIAKEWGLSAA